MEIGAELRLCEKRADMCEKEGFHDESVKTSRRRWTTAKNAYMKQRANKQQEDEAEDKYNGGTNGHDSTNKTTTTTSATACGGIDNDSVGGESDFTAPVLNTSTIPLYAPAPPNTTTGFMTTNPTTKSKKATEISPSFLHSMCLDLAETFLSDHQHEAAEVVISDGLTLLGDDLDDLPRMRLLKRYCQLLLFLSDKHGASAGTSGSGGGTGKHSRVSSKHKVIERTNSMAHSSFKSMYGDYDKSKSEFMTSAARDKKSVLGDLDVAMSEEEANYFIEMTTTSLTSTTKPQQQHPNRTNDDDNCDYKQGGLWESSDWDGVGDGHCYPSQVTFDTAATMPHTPRLGQGDGGQGGEGGYDLIQTAPLPLRYPDQSSFYLDSDDCDSGTMVGEGEEIEDRKGMLHMLDLLRTMSPSTLLPSSLGLDGFLGTFEGITPSQYSLLPPYQKYLIRVDNCIQEAISMMKKQCKEDFIESVSLGPLLHMAAESLDR